MGRKWMWGARYNTYKPQKPDWIQYVSNDSKGFWKAEDFYLDKIDKITFKNIHEYKWGFRSRFFYWIYDFEKLKWWIRLHGTTKEEFLIQASLIENWYFDINIWNTKGVYAIGKKEFENWHQVRYKKRFTNYNKDCENIDSLIWVLAKNLFSTDLIEYVLWQETKKFKWIIEMKKVFYSQLKILKNVKKNDKDRRNQKIHFYKNNEDWFFEKYWYTINDRYKKKYDYMLNYFWKENRVLIYNDFSYFADAIKRRYNEWRKNPKLYNEKDIKFWAEKYIEYKEEIRSSDFIKELINLYKESPFDFKKRLELFRKRFKELFPNEKL